MSVVRQRTDGDDQRVHQAEVFAPPARLSLDLLQEPCQSRLPTPGNVLRGLDTLSRARGHSICHPVRQQKGPYAASRSLAPPRPPVAALRRAHGRGGGLPSHHRRRAGDHLGGGRAQRAGGGAVQERGVPSRGLRPAGLFPVVDPARAGAPQDPHRGGQEQRRGHDRTQRRGAPQELPRAHRAARRPDRPGLPGRQVRPQAFEVEEVVHHRGRVPLGPGRGHPRLRVRAALRLLPVPRALVLLRGDSGALLRGRLPLGPERLRADLEPQPLGSADPARDLEDPGWLRDARLGREPARRAGRDLWPAVQGPGGADAAAADRHRLRRRARAAVRQLVGDLRVDR